MCLCNAVCFCHFHIIFWLMHISAVLFCFFFLIFNRRKKFHSTYSDFNGACLVIFVFQCFFWPICMIWIIFIISIFNSAEQCVLTVPLYFSFINECKYKVAVCVPSFVLRFLYFFKKSVVYNLERYEESATLFYNLVRSSSSSSDSTIQK